MAAHSSGTEIYKLDIKHDHTQSQAGSLVSLPVEISTAAAIPNDITTVLPHACVVAAMTATVTGGSTSAWTVHNFSNPAQFNIDQNIPNMPGIRTLIGGSYLLPQLSGALQGGFTSAPIALQDWSSMRSVYATVGTAPAGADITLTVYLQYPGESTWETIANLTIPDGSTNSWGTSGYTPTQMNHPYGVAWPVVTSEHRPLEGDSLIKYTINTIGSTTPGSDLTVYLQT
jgi:hypothetical protein